MKFRSARFKNFRLLRDLELQFSTSAEQRLTVIRAENETGKTTILNALQWVLFGADALPERGANYRLHPIDWDVDFSADVDIEGSIVFEHTYEPRWRSGSPDARTEVYLAVRRVREHVTANDRVDRAPESFSLYRKTEQGYTPELAGEVKLRQIMASNLRELFFTDGDRALSFITSEVPEGMRRKLVQRAIRDMLGFEILEAAQRHVRKAGEDIRGQVRALGGGTELNRLADELRVASERKGQIEEDLQRLNEDLTQLAQEQAAADQRLTAALAKGDREEIAAQLERNQQLLRAARADLQRARELHAQTFRSEALAHGLLAETIARAGSLLNELKARGRIPRTVTPVLKERLAMGLCICGAPLTLGTPGHDHVLRVLGEQEAESEVDDRLTTLRLVAEQKLATRSTADRSWSGLVQPAMKQRDAAANRVREHEETAKRLEAQLDEIPDIDVATIKQWRATLIERKERTDRDIGIKTEQLSQATRGVTKLTDDYNRALAKQERLQQIQFRLLAVQDMSTVLSGAYAAIQGEQIPQVSAQMNTYFLEMILAGTQQSLIQDAAVTDAFDIVVHGPDGRRLDPDRDLNGASRRALSLAFILALTNVSGVTAPNVIDTPLGMMSGAVKRSTLLTCIKHASQLILLLTRSEINDCEDILDTYAGVITTLTNTAHYPRMLENDPGVPVRTVIACSCSHRMSCAVCARKTHSGVAEPIGVD